MSEWYFMQGTIEEALADSTCCGHMGSSWGISKGSYPPVLICHLIINNQLGKDHDESNKVPLRMMYAPIYLVIRKTRGDSLSLLPR